MFNRYSIEAVARDRAQRREAQASVDRIVRGLRVRNPNHRRSFLHRRT